jgi:hypothetical protein
MSGKEAGMGQIVHRKPWRAARIKALACASGRMEQKGALRSEITKG